MGKGLFYGVLIGIAITSAAFFFIGRDDSAELRELSEQVSRDHREAKSNLAAVRGRVDGLTDTVTRITERADGIAERSHGADRNVSTLETGLNTVKERIDTIELRNRESISLIGELRDIDYEFRRFIESIKDKE